MSWKKIGKALLFPHLAVMLLLIPLSTVLLVGSMVFVGTDSPVAYVSYVLSAYTLTVWCMKTPRLIRFVQTFKRENKYARRWLEDPRLRVNVSLYGSFVWNALYGLFQVWLGFYHHTFWFYSLGAYYLCLCVMRFFLVRYTRRYAPGERMRSELVRYRACGWIFLVMNLALALIVFFMVYWGRTFTHHMITAIAMAAYTFSALSAAIVSVVKYRKYNSPVFSATKAISLAAALVSMLTLTSTMLTTFGDGTMDALTQKRMLGGVGFAVSALIVAMAICMILRGTGRLNILKEEERNGKQE
ncbi:MAG: hypothetical protein II369_01420 [Clostridia bacterium]|jgi:hypothetical protein|nr:hypothetical protein [Clostridia bacterium]